jgi:hypothetical protein
MSINKIKHKENYNKEDNLNKIPDKEYTLIDNNKSKSSHDIFLNKKHKIKKIKKYKGTTSISHITINSHFILDFKNPIIYYDNYNDKNLIKLNDKEYYFLNQKIKEIKYKNGLSKENINWIDLSKEIFENINNYFNIKIRKNKIEEFVENKLKENQSREKISCRKLAKLYFDETGNKISKTYINNLLRNNLKLSYLKTSIKTKTINEPLGKIQGFCFIKSIVKCLMAGFKILFLDESSILSSNNNFRAWRGKNEELYFNIGTKKRKNLLLIISNEEVIHYKITDKNTDEKNFLKFMEEVAEILDKKENEKFVIVMDNLASHRTKNLINFYKERKINIIFNCVYRSNFNAIELAFRNIKFYLYKNLYEKIEDAIKDINNILNDKKFRLTLSNNLYETLNKYIEFFDENKYMNLNNLNF